MISLTLQERKVLLFLTFFFVLGFALSVLIKKRTGRDACFSEILTRAQGLRPLNINEASRQELIALPEIGAKTADLIIAERKKRGAFKTTDELVDIKGISEARLGRLKEYIRVE